MAGGLVVGGIAGGYMISQAATATPSASAAPIAGSGHEHDAPGGFMGAGPAAHAQDLQQTAAAIGISAAQLQTELAAGKTIAAVAKEHNIDPARVISTLVADENAEIDAAVAGGQLTQAQASQMKTETAQRVTDMVNGVEPSHGPGGPGGGPQAEDQQVVAGVIGISASQLQTELSAGKTIAAVAKEHNVDVAKVIAAWVASENTEIDQRVSSGQLTAAEGVRMKAMTQQRITDEVNGTQPGRGGWGPHGGPPAGSSTQSDSGAGPTT
jgi:cytidylate kinase